MRERGRRGRKEGGRERKEKGKREKGEKEIEKGKKKWRKREKEKKWEGGKTKEGKERARAGGDCGMRGPAGGVRGRVHAREEREEKERFTAVGCDAPHWMGNGWDVR